MQLIFENGSIDEEGFAKAGKLRSEFVIAVTGVVEERGGAVNKNLATGEIELRVKSLRVLSEADVPPFPIEENSKTKEELRLKYRYLDLRRPDLQRNLVMKSKVMTIARQFMANEGFLEIVTPMLCKSTPEGARDYLVPSRIHPGTFYALPQSPQIYKQLLMCSGYDRYFQIARCFRDEDLRADRQPEFTQVDMELSFVDIDDVIEVNERLLKHLFKEVINVDVEIPFKRMPWQEAMDRFGSDKPDTRFGMEIQDITDTVKDIDFVVFKSAIEAGGSVRAINVKGGAATYTRKEIDKLVEHAKGIGAKGLAYIRWADEPNCSFKKFLGDGDLEKINAAVGAEKGDLVLICADKNKVVLPTLGALRLICGKRLGVIPEGKFNFVWITEMPFFEYDDENDTWVAAHHPFTMPMEECLDYLDTDPANVRAKAWDLVLNGTELSSGSMRITDFELQQKMFEALGMTDEEIEAKFGFLVDAYRYAAPPHGGMGIGLDRLSMIICNADSLRDVIAFPKVQNASELMSACPSTVDEKQLEELHIKTTETEE
jgi:aspartyl-tRNA synthetase